MGLIKAVYADGGVIQRNPSQAGGTWAYCYTDAAGPMDGNRVVENSGVITPIECMLPQVSNNVAELYALVRAFQGLPDGWVGTVYSDSDVTLARVFRTGRLAGVPRWLQRDLQRQLFRLDVTRMAYALLDGHPTRAHLAAGKGKRDRPVSIHNVWCDAACTEQAKSYVAKYLRGGTNEVGNERSYISRPAA